MFERWTHEEYRQRQRDGFAGLKSVQILGSQDGFYVVETISIDQCNKSTFDCGNGPVLWPGAVTEYVSNPLRLNNPEPNTQSAPESNQP